MFNSRCVPLAILIAAGIVSACEAPVSDPLSEDYVRIEAGLLSVCEVAPAAQVQRVIGVLGGSLSVSGVHMTLPPGAVAGDTEFRLHVPSSRHAEVDIRANGQEHFQFLAPVVISMDYSRCGTPAGPLSAWHIDPDTKALLENMGGVDDTMNRRVVFSTMHLSGYAIAN
jgi:hypothetical protein